MARSKPSESKQPFPERIPPMLASSASEPFDDPEWLYEIEWDGYRIIAHVRDGKATLRTPDFTDLSAKFQVVADELSGLPDCVLDGEMVVLDEEGRPDFELVKNYQGTGDIVYYIFDLIYLEGQSYINRPLIERKEMLLHVIKKEQYLTFSDDFQQGTALFEQLRQLGLIGMMAKRKASTYQPGIHSGDWVKVKISQKRNYVIGGWTESRTGKTFRSILLGEYVGEELRYVHQSGESYFAKDKIKMFSRLKNLEIKKCPFSNPKKIKAGTACHWVKPTMLEEFDLPDKLRAGEVLKQPSTFRNLEQIKKPAPVVPDVSLAMIKEIRKVREMKAESSTGSWETLEKQVITSEEPYEVEGETINLTNIERLVWTDVTKAELIQYYILASDYLLPFIKDRPLGINVSLGNASESFFIRGMEGRTPTWATTFHSERRHKKAGNPGSIEWLICNDIKTLVYIINLNCIDIHPWASRCHAPNNPDYITIDLEPSDKDFKKVIETARAAWQLFDSLNITGFVKTSGKTGMHLLVPTNGIEFGQARTIAGNLCKQLHELVPSITTTSSTLNSRGDLLYIDPSQNDYGDRIVAPYCPRAFHKPVVSAPLDWKEIKPGLDPHEFNIRTIMKRLEKKKDLWSGIFVKSLAASNAKAFKKLL